MLARKLMKAGSVDRAVRLIGFNGINNSVPAHGAGDTIFAVTVVTDTTTPPALISGWTSVITGSRPSQTFPTPRSARAYRLQRITDTTNTITTVTPPSGAFLEYIFVLRRFGSIVRVANRDGQNAAPQTVLPGLSSLAPNSGAILIGGGGTLNVVPSDAIFENTRTDDIGNPALRFTENHGISSFSDITDGTTLPEALYSLEVRP